MHLGQRDRGRVSSEVFSLTPAQSGCTPAVFLRLLVSSEMLHAITAHCYRLHLAVATSAN